MAHDKTFDEVNSILLWLLRMQTPRSIMRSEQDVFNEKMARETEEYITQLEGK